MDDKVPSGGCEGISGSRPGILALRFALEHTPSQPRRRTNVTLPSLKRPRRRLIDNERGDAEERRFAQRQRAARQGVTQDRGHCQRPRALARPCRLAGIPGFGQIQGRGGNHCPGGSWRQRGACDRHSIEVCASGCVAWRWERACALPVRAFFSRVSGCINPSRIITAFFSFQTSFYAPLPLR